MLGLVSESYGLIFRIKANTLIDLTQGDLSIMFSVHVPLAILITLCLIPISLTQFRYKDVGINIAEALTIFSISALISGLIWGQAIWGHLIIADKKILDIILIICYYYIISKSNRAKIRTVITITTAYYLIKISITDVNSIHQNINSKSGFYNSIPKSYTEMIINNILITVGVLTLYIILS